VLIAWRQSLNELGNLINNKKVMQRWLHIAPKRYSRPAMSIYNLIDLHTSLIEEIVGRFKAAGE
jgi:hypothetical protein